MRAAAFLAVTVVLAGSVLFGGSAVLASQSSGATPEPRMIHSLEGGVRSLVTSSGVSTAAHVESAWATGLPELHVRCRNTGAHGRVRLYDARGELDDAAALQFMQIASTAREDTTEPEILDPRLVQLVARAAYHFKNAPIAIVSATRKGARGKHGTGEALDFALEGVRASVLASYLRGYPRAGVGIYTHPKTQYVHLDVRDESYHWLDASPPHVTWRERRIGDPKRAARDDAYLPAMDLPETASSTGSGSRY
ncbi:hypothetical protein AKJ09_06609 [Labilithrix luteola]|uniref:Peptidase M15A C-terminal domain-containing protein n=1 Tax=Labilithrix luteola TaxID=1391654 RepID=A0A0K1Q2A6_9BACT|nr:DUF882 domain-containing protein [Labilithrix luteola]AKU99945.1 hypothetical protein AKJ09_06609 [Labilithrix luteola]